MTRANHGTSHQSPTRARRRNSRPKTTARPIAQISNSSMAFMAYLASLATVA
jgi:hypothetical protein